MREITKVLDLPNSSNYKTIQQAIRARFETNDVNAMQGHNVHNIVKDTKREQLTITSCNRRGMNNKTTTINGLEFWNYCTELNSQILLQDHRISDQQASIMSTAARKCIPHMHNCTLASQQGNFTAAGKQRIGGTAVLLGGKAADNSSTQLNDPRGWGRFTGKLIEGRSGLRGKSNRDKRRDPRQIKKLIVISAYCPVESIGTTESSQSMWKYQSQKIQQLPPLERQMKTRKRRDTGISELIPDPLEQFKYDLANFVKKWGTKHSANVVIMGDFNIDLHKNNKNRASIMKWASDLGLVNPYVEMQTGDTLEEKLHTIDKAHEQGGGIYTWFSSEQKHSNRPDCRCCMCTGVPESASGKVSRAHLDHVWVSHDLYRRRALMGYGVADFQIANTDHRPVTITLDLMETLGIGRNHHKVVEQERRILKYQNEKQRSHYMEQLDTLVDESNLKEELEKIYKNLESTTQEQLDSLMQLLIDCMTHAEESIDTEPQCSGKRKFRTCYTPDMMGRILATCECRGLLKRAYNKDKMLATLDYHRISQKYGKYLKLDACPHLDDPSEEWRGWAKKIEKQIKRLRKSLHHKKVSQEKKDRSEYDRKIEEARLNSRNSKLFYGVINMTQYSPPPTQLMVKGRWIDDPREIKEVEREQLTQQMYGRKNTFHTEGDRVNPFCENTDEGKSLRKGIADGTSDEWKQYVPIELHDFYKHGKRILTDEHLKDAGVFTTPVSFKEYDAYIMAKTKNKAGGGSGIRIDHLCSASIEVRQLIYQVLNLPMLTKRSFVSWDKEIINWIPKEPGNPDIDRRRPIALLEVMRKCALGVRKNRVLEVWMKHGCIDKDNFAFMPGEFIHDPILLKRLLLEDAVFLQNMLITLDVDYKAAFDKVPYFIKEMALRRMGVPEEGIDLWCKHDHTRHMSVRTAYGLTEPIHPRCGAFAQGGEESPMGFVALMCWKCAYIFEEDKETDCAPYECSAGARSTVKLSKTLFCDDSAYTTASYDGAQYILNRIGMFAAAAGMELNIKKTFYVVMNCIQRELQQSRKLSIPMPEFDVDGWQVNGTYAFQKPILKMEITQQDPKHEWRHLGNFQDNLCNSAALLKEVEKIIAEDLTYLATRRLSPDGYEKGYNTKVKMKILYRTKHGNLSKNQLMSLQTKIYGQLKSKMKILRHLPNDLLYGHKLVGGLEQTHLWDETNIEKCILLQTMLADSKRDIFHAVSGAIARLQRRSCSQFTPLETPWNGLWDLDDKDWLTSLWKWMTELGIVISVPKTSLSHQPYEGDVCIIDKFIEYKVKQLSEDDAHALRLLARGEKIDPSQTIRALTSQVKLLTKKLRAENVKWASDITIPVRRTGRATRSHQFNRLLAARYRPTNESQRGNWVKQHLFGIPGLFTHWGRCDFTLGEPSALIGDPTFDPYDWLERFQKDEASDIADLDALQDMNPQGVLDQHVPGCDEVICATDGSVKKTNGTFAYIFMNKGEKTSSLYGGGRQTFTELHDELASRELSLPLTSCQYRDQVNRIVTEKRPQRMSSARMEALALLALHAATYEIDPHHTHSYKIWCDSEAAINIYKRVKRMNRMELPQQNNSDVWRIIRWYQQKWGTMTIKHVPSHMDQYVKNPEHMKPEWVMNCLVDELADTYYQYPAPVHNSQLTRGMYGILKYRNQEVCLPIRKWAKNLVALHRGKQFFDTHHSSMKEGIAIDWNSMSSAIKGYKHLWQRKQMMQLIWHLQPTNHEKFIRGHCNPSENKCVFCGKAMETHDHIYKECTAQKVQQFKRGVYQDLAEELANLFEDDGIQDWLSRNISRIWEGRIATPSFSALGDDLFEDININQIKSFAWSGLATCELTKLFGRVAKADGDNAQNIFRAKSIAKRAAQKTHAILTQAAHDLWHLRHESMVEAQEAEAEKRVSRVSQPARRQQQSKAKLSALDEKASALIDRQLMKINGRAISWEEYTGIPRRLREQRTIKCLRTLNCCNEEEIDPKHLPTVGQKVRSYVLDPDTRQCTAEKATIVGYSGIEKHPYIIRNDREPSQYNLASRENLLHRTAEDKGLTAEETKLQDAHLEKVFPETESNQSGGAYKGGIADITVDSDEETGEIEAWATVIYEDEDSENLPLQTVIQKSVFKEDPLRHSKLHALYPELGKRTFPTGHILRKGISSKRAKRRRKYLARKRAVTHKATLLAAYEQEKREQRTGWSWNWARNRLFPPVTPLGGITGNEAIALGLVRRAPGLPGGRVGDG